MTTPFPKDPFLTGYFAPSGVECDAPDLVIEGTLPNDLAPLFKRFKRVLVPEINSGQLIKVLRAEYLVDAVGFNRVRGQPLQVQELLTAINALIEVKS